MNEQIFPVHVTEQVGHLQNLETEHAELKRCRESIADQVRRANAGIGDPRQYDILSLRRELVEIDERIGSVECALPEQRRKTRDLICQASAESINRRYRSEYEQDAVAEVYACAVALGNALEKEKRHCDALENTGIQLGSLYRVQFPRVGLPSDPQSPLTFFLREIEQNYPRVLANKSRRVL
jgi:hypothetical protein